MTHRGVRDNGIHACVGHVESVGIAHAELGALADAFVVRQALRPSTNTGLCSMPITRPANPSRPARARVTTPVPQPRSSTWAVGARSIFAT